MLLIKKLKRKFSFQSEPGDLIAIRYPLKYILLKHYDVTIHEFIESFIKRYIIVLNPFC